MLGRVFLVGGLTCATGSGIKAAAGAPVGAIGGALGLGFLIVVLGAICDWNDLDRTIHYAGAIIGFVSLLTIVGLFFYGQIAPAVVLSVLFGLGWLIALPISHAIDERWDTPERRLAEYFRDGCAPYYSYSYTDGYCHFKHEIESYDREFHADNSGYTETRVPSEDYGLHEQPLPGALENIARLKAAAAAEMAAGPSFVSRFIDHVIWHMWKDIHILVFFLFISPIAAVLKEYVFDRYKDDPAAGIAAVRAGLYAIWNGPQKKPAAAQPEMALEADPHAWLAEGRKSAGLD